MSFVKLTKQNFQKKEPVFLEHVYQSNKKKNYSKHNL